MWVKFYHGNYWIHGAQHIESWCLGYYKYVAFVVMGKGKNIAVMHF